MISPTSRSIIGDVTEVLVGGCSVPFWMRIIAAGDQDRDSIKSSDKIYSPETLENLTTESTIFIRHGH